MSQFESSSAVVRGKLSLPRLKEYYALTKPGVLYGNVLTGAAGFLLAAGYFHVFKLELFAATIIGMTLVIAAACVLNNYLDRDVDRIMTRTRARATARGDIGGGAVVFATLLGVIGTAVLALWVNWLVVSIGIVGFIIYVWLYGALSKRQSLHGTLVGSISGALPILAGYCAVAGRLDVGAVLLFLMLFFWQFPEFYSIAIYRREEYKAAGIPVISVVRGLTYTKIWIFIYTVLFVIATLLLTPLGYTGWVYFGVMALLGLYWIRLGRQGLKPRTVQADEAWARRMFGWAMIMILALSLALAAGPLLP
jgi:protoheme IX farnesyltransferase